MADYLYMLDSRLSPEQQRAVVLAQEAARAHGMNLYITGGTIRDIVSGFAIRDLDFTVEGNPLKLQKDLERGGVEIQGINEATNEMFVQFGGNVRAGINMARAEKYNRPGKPPEISAAPIGDDLRRRDFTVNAMALSLNPGSRGLLLDPANGIADLESKVIRILHNYSFLEDPSRLIRATRFMARLHWTMEERTQARYDAAVENGYMEHISERAMGQESEQLAYEDEPLPIMRALEKEGWLKVLHPHWSVAKVDAHGLGQLLRNRQQMADLGYSVNAAAAVLYFITAKLNSKDLSDLQKHMPRKSLVKSWDHLEHDAKELAHRLVGKEAATPSRTWQLLSQSRPDLIIFLETTSRQQQVVQKIRNYIGKWRQVRQNFPLPEMAELRITPELPEYPKLVEEMFLLMIDGKLRNSSDITKFLKPYSPPLPPPPPPPVRRGRAKRDEKAAAAEGAAATPEKGAKPAKKWKKGATQPEPVVPPAAPAPAKAAAAPAKATAKKVTAKTKPAKTKPKAAKPKAAKAKKAHKKKK